MFNYGNVRYGVFKQKKIPPPFKKNNDWNDAVDEIGRPEFNIDGLFRQKSIPPPFKPNNNWGDAVDLIERPIFDAVQDSSEIAASTFEPYYKRLEVELGDKTLNKVLKIDKKDVNDLEWLNEYKRRKALGESDEQLKRFPPFGRKQNTIRVERTFNNAGSFDTKLKILNKEMDKSSANELELAKQLTVLLKDVDELTKLQFQLVRGLVEKFETEFTLKNFGFDRFYTKKGIQEIQGVQRGRLLFYILGRATRVGDDPSKPILKIDSESDLELEDEKSSYVASTSIVRAMSSPDSVIDLENLTIYNSREAIINRFGDVEANNGLGDRVNVGRKYLQDTTDEDETTDEDQPADVKTQTRVSPPSSPGSQVSTGDFAADTGTDTDDGDTDDEDILGDLTERLASM